MYCVIAQRQQQATNWMHGPIKEDSLLMSIISLLTTIVELLTQIIDGESNIIALRLFVTDMMFLVRQNIKH